MAELRCEITRNPCGTDTWQENYECPCASCQAWLNPPGNNYFLQHVRSARREIAHWNRDRIANVQLQGTVHPSNRKR